MGLGTSVGLCPLWHISASPFMSELEINTMLVRPEAINTICVQGTSRLTDTGWGFAMLTSCGWIPWSGTDISCNVSSTVAHRSTVCTKLGDDAVVTPSPEIGGDQTWFPGGTSVEVVVLDAAEVGTTVHATRLADSTIYASQAPLLFGRLALGQVRVSSTYYRHAAGITCVGGANGVRWYLARNINSYSAPSVAAPYVPDSTGSGYGYSEAVHAAGYDWVAAGSLKANWATTPLARVADPGGIFAFDLGQVRVEIPGSVIVNWSAPGCSLARWSNAAVNADTCWSELLPLKGDNPVLLLEAFNAFRDLAWIRTNLTGAIERFRSLRDEHAPVVVITGYPSQEADSVSQQWISDTETVCTESLGISYHNTYGAMLPYAEGNILGHYADITHLNEPGRLVFADITGGMIAEKVYRTRRYVPPGMEHASTIEWLAPDLVRVTYDWTDDDQLLDWTATAGAIATRTAGIVTVTGGATDIRGIRWNQAGAVQRVRWSANGLTSGFANIYTNLSPAWNGTPYNPTVGLGHVWTSGGPEWIVNGTFTGYAGAGHADNVAYNMGFLATATRIASYSSIDSTWRYRTGTYVLSRDGHLALGAYGGDNAVGPVTIVARIRWPYLAPAGTCAFNTTGATFTADITVAPGATIHWDFGDGTTSDSDHPVHNWGVAADRMVTLSVSPTSALQAVVIGYGHEDGGAVGDPMLPDLAPQSVRDVFGLTNFQNLRAFAASGTQVGILDLHGLAHLDTVECYHASQLKSVNVTGCVALGRLCLEQANLQALDLSTCTALADLRCAENPILADITWPSTGASIWHVCIRDNPSLSLSAFPVASWPVIEECWAWNSQISGDLVFTTAAALSLELYANSITSINLAGAPNADSILVANNSMNQAAVDAVLVALAAGVVAGGTVDVSGNTAPSAAGAAAAATLTGRGWTVTTD